MTGIDIDFALAISDTVVVQVIAVTDTAVDFFLVGLKAKRIGEFHLICFSLLVGQ